MRKKPEESRIVFHPEGIWRCSWKDIQRKSIPWVWRNRTGSWVYFSSNAGEFSGPPPRLLGSAAPYLKPFGRYRDEKSVRCRRCQTRGPKIYVEIRYDRGSPTWFVRTQLIALVSEIWQRTGPGPNTVYPWRTDVGSDISALLSSTSGFHDSPASSWRMLFRIGVNIWIIKGA